jgi:hypothetical protein
MRDQVAAATMASSVRDVEWIKHVREVASPPLVTMRYPDAGK